MEGILPAGVHNGGLLLSGTSPPRWWEELAGELELRAGLIREQWEIRGPGLLRAIQERAVAAGHPAVSGNDDNASELVVELVLPLSGGACGLLSSGKGWMEAVLHDLSPQFTESLRVGWLAAWRLTGEPRAAAKLLLQAAGEVDWLATDPLTESACLQWLGLEAGAESQTSANQAEGAQ